MLCLSRNGLLSAAGTDLTSLPNGLRPCAAHLLKGGASRTTNALPSSAVDLPVRSLPFIFFGKPGVSIDASTVVIVEKRGPIDMGAAALECWGCSFCAGVISPRLDKILGEQRLSVPDEIVQGRFDYVWIQGQWKNFRLRVPKDMRMYSVFRGSLPGRRSGRPAGFDGFLLGEAVKEGAQILYGKVEAMAYGASGLPRLTVRAESGESVPLDASFVTIATGINAHCGLDYRD